MIFAEANKFPVPPEGKFACQGAYLDVQCEKGSLISVNSANFGRKVGSLHCPLRGLLSNFLQTCMGHDLGWVN